MWREEARPKRLRLRTRTDDDDGLFAQTACKQEERRKSQTAADEQRRLLRERKARAQCALDAQRLARPQCGKLRRPLPQDAVKERDRPLLIVDVRHAERTAQEMCALRLLHHDELPRLGSRRNLRRKKLHLPDIGQYGVVQNDNGILQRFLQGIVPLLSKVCIFLYYSIISAKILFFTIEKTIKNGFVRYERYGAARRRPSLGGLACDPAAIFR